MINGRGFSHWGLSEWGFGDRLATEATRPQIIYKSPIPGQINVLETVPLHVQFFHEEFALDLASAEIYIDDVLIYGGLTEFFNGARGSVKTISGVTSVILYPAQGFQFGSRTNVRAAISDLDGDRIDEAWSFLVREDPASYLGADALPIEEQIQRPILRFTPLDHLRHEFLNYAIPERLTHIVNRGNKAARVLYQTAFATELCTLQNPFSLRNDAVLQVVVNEKENLLVLDQKMQLHRETLEAAIVDFRNQGVFKEDYLKSFLSYMDAPTYLYRTSLIANLVLYGAAYELGHQHT
jgi:hypothetical protein